MFVEVMTPLDPSETYLTFLFRLTVLRNFLPIGLIRHSTAMLVLTHSRLVCELSAKPQLTETEL
jgi:hypothetical protein